MPRATVSLDPQEVSLTTCPGGWVKLRRMSYGELLTSNDMAFQIDVSQENGSRDPKMGVGASTVRIAEYRFQNCVVDHNLTNEADQKLDFKNPAAMHLLDPNIGQEIDNLIEKMHNWQSSIPNSETPSLGASSATSETKTSLTVQTTSQNSSSD